MELHEALGREVDAWREAGYPSDVPSLAEILDFATDIEGGDGAAAHLRYLPPPQLRALETYWYLRVRRARHRATLPPQ